MLQGEDVLLEQAEETGYRLCRFQPSSADRHKLAQKVFSVTWDANDSNTFYISYQDGSLEVVNHDAHHRSSEHYQIRFRQYLLQTSAQPPAVSSAVPTSRYGTQERANIENNLEKVIHSHWDKFVSIPQSPKEFFFLLGISRTVMYTSLPADVDHPYPAKPFLSSVTRSDFEGYIFGTPVVQVNQHDGRITSIACSPLGHLLASGDEFGLVKILLLKSPNSHLLQGMMESDHGLNVQHRFSSNFNVAERIHQGPIFALSWLPMIATSRDHVTHYGLVTGSVDRAVRLWNVGFSNNDGITLSPMMNFDTLSTHVLALNTFIHHCIYDLKSDNDKSIKSSNYDDDDDDFDDRSFEEGTLTQTGSQAQTTASQFLNMDQQVYVSAGTNLGTVHIWKVVAADLVQLMRANPYSKANNVLKKQPMDDGKHMLALLQVSDQPILHISSSPSVFNLPSVEFDSMRMEMLMAIADIRGKVKVYTTTMELPPEEVGTELEVADSKHALHKQLHGMNDRLLLQNIRQRYSDVYTFSPKKGSNSIFNSPLQPANNVKFGDTSLHIDIPTNVNEEEEFIVPLKEEQYSHAIVACAFSHHHSSAGFDGAPGGVHQVTYESSSRRELLICTMDGNMRVYSSDSFRVKDFRDQQERAKHQIGNPQPVTTPSKAKLNLNWMVQPSSSGSVYSTEDHSINTTSPPRGEDTPHSVSSGVLTPQRDADHRHVQQHSTPSSVVEIMERMDSGEEEYATAAKKSDYSNQDRRVGFAHEASTGKHNLQTETDKRKPSAPSSQKTKATMKASFNLQAKKSSAKNAESGLDLGEEDDEADEPKPRKQPPPRPSSSKATASSIQRSSTVKTINTANTLTTTTTTTTTSTASSKKAVTNIDNSSSILKSTFSIQQKQQTPFVHTKPTISKRIAPAEDPSHAILRDPDVAPRSLEVDKVVKRYTGEDLEASPYLDNRLAQPAINSSKVNFLISFYDFFYYFDC